jgi:anti-sigma factor RsiW
MSCADLQRDLERLRDGELDAGATAAAEQHLATCAACRELLSRARGFDAWMRTRLGSETASPALHAAVRAASTARTTPPPRPIWIRALASPWAPRLAMAAVLAFVLAAPLVWLPQRAGALALTAARQHAAHEGGAPGDPLPPCCTAVAASVGTRLGEPSPGVVVPDLAGAGLALAGATRCTFAPTPVSMLVYAGPGGAYSLYATAHGSREFAILRPGDDGAAVHRSVAVPGDAHHGPERLEVTIWKRDGIVYTWVGPAGAAYEAGRDLLRAGH